MKDLASLIYEDLLYTDNKIISIFDTAKELKIIEFNMDENDFIDLVLEEMERLGIYYNDVVGVFASEE